MSQGKTIIMLLVTFVGFAGGFVLRPVIAPAPHTSAAARSLPVVPVPTEARGTQYFVAHIDEVRQIVTGSRDGSVRGVECATAEEVIKVEAEERRRRFLGN